jgi:hypothetical protein
MLGEDEKIFQVKSWLCEKGGVSMEKQGVSDRSVVDPPDQRLGVAAFAEKSLPQSIFGCAARKLLVFRETADEAEHVRDIRFASGVDAGANCMHGLGMLRAVDARRKLRG